MGLSGSFGTVLAGIHDTPFKILGRKVDLFDDQIGDARNLISAPNGGTSFDLRSDNLLAWTSKDLGGIKVMVAMAAKDGLEDADIINLLRIQHERQRKSMFPSIGEFASLFGLTKSRLTRTKPDAIIMHPGPINRGVEIDSDIADSGRSVILEQVTNGLAVRRSHTSCSARPVD